MEVRQPPLRPLPTIVVSTFIRSARHLSRQHKRGITSSDRDQRIIKLMLALMVLGLFFWYFFLR